MRGSTRKRGDTWTAYWRTPDAASGEQRQRTKGGFATRRAAQEHLRGVLGAIDDGITGEPSKTPLATFMRQEWLPAVRGQLRPATVRAYEQCLRAHVERRAIGQVPLRAITPGVVNAWLTELDVDAGLAVGTRRLAFAVLRRALGDAHRWDKIRRNPAAQANPPAAPRTRATAWTAGELRRFLDHVKGERLFALYRLAATTGMRRGELLGLTWQQLDLDHARLRVTQQLLPGLSFGPPKSRRGERTVALDEQTIAALRVHRDTQLAERAFAGPAYGDRDLVFCDELGGPIRPDRLTQVFIARRKRSGVPTGTLHTLRHTAVTLMLVSGVPLHVVAARVGDRPETVLSTYSHLLPTSDVEAATTIAGVIAPVDVPLTNPAGTALSAR